MSELAQNCENYAILTQNYTLELFIAFKMAYSCCFSFEGNLDFLDILQKSFITSTAGCTVFVFIAGKQLQFVGLGLLPFFFAHFFFEI